LGIGYPTNIGRELYEGIHINLNQISKLQIITLNLIIPRFASTSQVINFILNNIAMSWGKYFKSYIWGFWHFFLTFSQIHQELKKQV
jgi:hypothetical protein